MFFPSFNAASNDTSCLWSFFNLMMLHHNTHPVPLHSAGCFNCRHCYPGIEFFCHKTYPMTFALFLPGTTSKTKCTTCTPCNLHSAIFGGQHWTMPCSTASGGNATSCCKLDFYPIWYCRKKHKGAAFRNQFLQPKFFHLCPFNYAPNNKKLTPQVDSFFWQCLAMPNTTLNLAAQFFFLKKPNQT